MSNSRHESDLQQITELKARVTELEVPEKLSVLVELELQQLKATL